MGIRKTHIQQSGYYFITFTNYKWLPLIAATKAYDLVYQWFDYLKKEGHQIVGYVIMPNHIHLMLAYRENTKSINTLVGNGKRLLSYGIVSRLKEQTQTELLTQLTQSISLSEKERGQKHKVFRDSFDLQHCYSQKFMLQKLKYIHDNPCVKKWMLADNPLDYLHSSAAFYAEGKQGVYPILSWLTLEAENGV